MTWVSLPSGIWREIDGSAVAWSGHALIAGRVALVWRVRSAADGCAQPHMPGRHPGIAMAGRLPGRVGLGQHAGWCWTHRLQTVHRALLVFLVAVEACAAGFYGVT